MDDFKLDSTTNLLLLYLSEPIQNSEDQSGMTINALLDYDKNDLVWKSEPQKEKNYFNLIDNKIFLNTKKDLDYGILKLDNFYGKLNLLCI